LQSPVLQMDLDVVAAAYRRMTGAMPAVGLHYAMKCNGYRPVLQRLKDLGCGFEIASARELDDLLEIGVVAAEVLFSNPVKAPAQIAHTYAAGVRTFAFDSTSEIDKLAHLAPGSNVVVRLAAVDHDSDVPSEGKFGVDSDGAVDLLLAARDRGLRPYGVAFHVGSQMMRPAAWKAPLDEVAAMMTTLADADVPLEMVDVGGGFPAVYDLPPPPMSEYGAVIGAGLERLPYPVRAVAEPGRALVAEAGTLVSTVIGTAVRGGRKWVHLDVGAFNGLMESLETGNRLRFPIRDSIGSSDPVPCHLTGPTCDSQDTILFDVPLSPDLTTGDRVFIESAGAYTTVYASTFNGFTVPDVHVVGSVSEKSGTSGAHKAHHVG
jgi:ornithine decarboxylase